MPGDAAEALVRFGDPTAAPLGAAAVLLADGYDLADVVRALDAAGIEVAQLRLHAPTLDDVFLAKTGRTLEGEGEDAATEAVPA